MATAAEAGGAMEMRARRAAGVVEEMAAVQAAVAPEMRVAPEAAAGRSVGAGLAAMAARWAVARVAEERASAWPGGAEDAVEEEVAAALEIPRVVLEWAQKTRAATAMPSQVISVMAMEMLARPLAARARPSVVQLDSRGGPASPWWV